MEKARKPPEYPMTPNPITTEKLVEHFATPPWPPETDYDRKALSDAALLEIPFENQLLTAYAWGSGPGVLLAHGWASRASHMAPLARVLLKAGFRVVAFDQPAHGRSHKPGQATRSSMPEFARAIATVGHRMGPLYGLVGHSLGGAAAALAVGGSPVIRGIQLPTERLVLISSPAGALSIVESYCRENGLPERKEELMRAIEEGYGFPVEAYAVDPSLRNCSARVLIIHDQEDDQVPFAEAEKLHLACPGSQLVAIQGAGHGGILSSRTMLKSVRDFLVDP